MLAPGNVTANSRDQRKEKIDGEFGGYSPAVTCLVDLDLPYLGPNVSKKNIAQPWWWRNCSS